MKDKIEILKTIHATLCNGIRAGKSTAARTWIEGKGLSIEATGACFNSGQLHHRQEQNFLDELESVGFITKAGINKKNPDKLSSYTSFGMAAIVFALRNEKYEVVNMYAIRIHLETEKTEYLNQDGIYPAYPPLSTKRLYITQSIMDAATLLESRVLDNRDAVIALYDGELKPQHLKALSLLINLEEIIFIS
jgi:hypothetical protein